MEYSNVDFGNKMILRSNQSLANLIKSKQTPMIHRRHKNLERSGNASTKNSYA